MERKTRLWLGLGTAVLVGGGITPVHAVPAGDPPAAGLDAGQPRAIDLPARISVPLLRLAQEEAASFEGGEGGEGEGGEGGGQVLGTITEFRLTSTDPNAYRYDASRQVETYAAVVHERYVAAHEGARQMQDAIARLLADPSPETLDGARAAWIGARVAYMQTEAYLFYSGPIDGEGGPVARINAGPANGAFIDYVQGNPNSGIVNDLSILLNRATLARLNQAAEEGDVATGWHAIEFLLWGEDLSPDGPGARPHTDYVAGQGNNDRRREYLRVIAQLLVNDLSTLVAAWAPDANNYRATILAMDQRNAIGRAFNGMAVLAGYEMALKRIGASLRRTDDEYEPSRFSDTTTADHVNDLRGIRDVYFGKASGVLDGGFDALLGTIDPALNERVIAAFDRAGEAVAALDTPYDRILASPPGSPERARAEAAAASLKDLADALRAAGNRLGVLVLIPGI